MVGQALSLQAPAPPPPLARMQVYLQGWDKNRRPVILVSPRGADQSGAAGSSQGLHPPTTTTTTK